MQTNKLSAGPVTHEGAPAVPNTDLRELRRSVLACLLWEDAFYESDQSIADRIMALSRQVPIAALSALAIEAREQMKLRHVPLHLCVAMATRPDHGMFLRQTVARVIQRPDELCELLSLYSKDRPGTKKLNKLPNGMKRGLADAFVKFSAYDLAKYNRARDINLRDVLFLVHAKPKDNEQAETWKKLINGTLESPDTWEVRLSAGEDKRAVFEDLIANKKLGALALLRNLRNMTEAQVPVSTIKTALETMRTDRVLPFRFIAAARAVPQLEPYIEPAMLRALAEQDKLPGRTTLIIDNSGSMYMDKLSQKSDMTRADSACALAVLLREICDECRVIAFSTSPAEVPPRRGFALVDAIQRATDHGATNTQHALDMANQREYDRIIVVTDEQSHQAIQPPIGKGYVINVASYQHGIGFGPWVHISGWSEAVVDFIRQLELEESHDH